MLLRRDYRYVVAVFRGEVIFSGDVPLYDRGGVFRFLAGQGQRVFVPVSSERTVVVVFKLCAPPSSLLFSVHGSESRSFPCYCSSSNHERLLII